MQNTHEKKPASPQEGTVISYFGSSVAVEAADGQVFQCQLRRNQELPVVGDRVVWQIESENSATLAEILPRKSTLIRSDTRGKTKPIAANIDTILIVMSPPPIFSSAMVDRYLVAAELLKIEPAIVLNKMDLFNSETEKEAQQALAPYQAIPYPVILSSVLLENGLSDLSQYLQSKTAVLVGPSGVGKSSIIAALNQANIRIGDVTEKGIGKHTTTATRLYHLPSGGALIDSPGVRDFNLWSVSQADLLHSFKEFLPYAKACRFRDCKHLVEPGCGVQKARDDGKISASRHASYQKLMKDANK